MTILGYQASPAGARRRRVRVVELISAGAAAVAALALLTVSPSVDTAPIAASGPSAAAPFATDDTNFVNDQGQTSGDIFTQNAQDQN
jgi:hypothetical protein